MEHRVRTVATPRAAAKMRALSAPKAAPDRGRSAAVRRHIARTNGNRPAVLVRSATTAPANVRWTARPARVQTATQSRRCASRAAPGPAGWSARPSSAANARSGSAVRRPRPLPARRPSPVPAPARAIMKAASPTTAPHRRVRRSARVRRSPAKTAGTATIGSTVPRLSPPRREHSITVSPATLRPARHPLRVPMRPSTTVTTTTCPLNRRPPRPGRPQRLRARGLLPAGRTLRGIRSKRTVRRPRRPRRRSAPPS